MHAAYSQELGIDLNVVKPLGACKAYTDFLAAASTAAKSSVGAEAKKQQVVVICAAMAPCMRLYAFLGAALAAAGAGDTAGPIFVKWVNEYSSAEFEGLAAKLEALLNKCFSYCPETTAPSTKALATTMYVDAMRYELAFFAAPLDNTGTEPLPPASTATEPAPAAPSDVVKAEPPPPTAFSSGPSPPMPDAESQLCWSLCRAAAIMPPRMLIVAGSDSGGGAGIQADMKAVAAFVVFSTTAITAVTAQNSQGVQGVQVLPPEFVKQQMSSVLEDLGTDVVKTGMLATADIVHVVADQLVKSPPHAVVVDPVMASRSGDSLLDASAIDAYRTRLLPLSTVLTPNLHEAQLLLSASNGSSGGSSGEGKGEGEGEGVDADTGSNGVVESSAGSRWAKKGAIGDVAAMEEAARALAALGPAWVLVKGGGLHHQVLFNIAETRTHMLLEYQRIHETLLMKK